MAIDSKKLHILLRTTIHIFNINFGDSFREIHTHTHIEAEAPILWPPDAKRQLTGKYPDAGKDWEQEEKGTAEDDMVR